MAQLPAQDVTFLCVCHVVIMLCIRLHASIEMLSVCMHVCVAWPRLYCLSVCESVSLQYSFVASVATGVPHRKESRVVLLGRLRVPEKARALAWGPGRA
jgi:hypothetical protein